MPMPRRVKASDPTPAPSSSISASLGIPQSAGEVSSSCWQNFKSKISSFGRKIDEWTYSKLPPAAAKCVLIIAKHLPIAIALMLLPSSIVLGIFALGAVIRIISPAFFTSYETLTDVASAAAKTMGIYSSILGIYNALAFSFSADPYSRLISMAVHLGIAAVSFYAANQWEKTEAPQPATPAEGKKAMVPAPAPVPLLASTPPAAIPASPRKSKPPTPKVGSVTALPATPRAKPTTPRGLQVPALSNASGTVAPVIAVPAAAKSKPASKPATPRASSKPPTPRTLSATAALNGSQTKAANALPPTAADEGDSESAQPVVKRKRSKSTASRTSQPSTPRTPPPDAEPEPGATGTLVVNILQATPPKLKIPPVGTSNKRSSRSPSPALATTPVADLEPELAEVLEPTTPPDPNEPIIVRAATAQRTRTPTPTGSRSGTPRGGPKQHQLLPPVVDPDEGAASSPAPSTAAAAPVIKGPAATRLSKMLPGGGKPPPVPSRPGSRLGSLKIETAQLSAAAGTPQNRGPTPATPGSGPVKLTPLSLTDIANI